ncbi:lysyl-tRNA synthetase class 2 [Friedmanniella endophytica]|uniref:Lysine--tRNA ligase n=1 Tax=Microlunatus kandeliicorticis TaxID=1759536 RepID=A0A7W3IVS8_9ACTN|nr:bifunctional lysylphosphatidylglycerol synthetase/lysine--tRNA ligase LysX [Microlunatus kandeliicorticis]MBA8796085.1 lysyl-tRNA synthetase class 2 [Microlunatus kandeliicorticis]
MTELTVPGSALRHTTSTRTAPPGRIRRLPYLASRIYFLAAAILVLQALFPGVFWFGRAADVYSTIFIPIDSSGIGLAAFAIILGGAMARRKRVAWWVTTVISLVWLAALLVLVVFFTVLIIRGVTIGVGNTLLLARFAFNLATMGAVVTVLIRYRGEFRARRQAGNVRKAVLTLAVGMVISAGVGLLLTTVFPGDLLRPRGRIAWLANQVFGFDNDDLSRTTTAPPTWTGTITGLFISASLVAAMIVLTRSQRRAAFLSADDEAAVRSLLPASSADSLAYFATRRDKSVIFGRDQRSAVTYRVELGVCLASSDPLGHPDHWPSAINAWLRLVEEYGWTPAVIGASEAGARAYSQAGLRVIRLGDEAVIEPARFSLEGREMRPVRQAVNRLQRQGYRTRIRRHRDIEPGELAALIGKTDAWRDTETERGFSMALSRLGDPADGDCLMVEALFARGQAPSAPAGSDGATPAPGPGAGDPTADVAGILSFVPWGSDGLSLDVMRRHPQADNGVTELMVTALAEGAGDVGVRRISLNFAVFRSAFEEGARIGAGPVLRLWRRLLLVASRWWQIESLYRSNVKYRPDWVPRFLCFAETRDIALVGAASGVAEGFIDLPSFLRPPVPPARALAGTTAPRVAATAAAGGAVAAELPTGLSEPTRHQRVHRSAADGVRLDEQTRNRMDVRARLLEAGTDPYPPWFRPTTASTGITADRVGAAVSVAGRVMRVRDHGGVLFATLRDADGETQLLLERDRIGADLMARFRSTVDLGDHLGAEGVVALSRTGQPSVGVAEFLITAKSLHPMPDKYRGLTDPEAKVRQRYLDLATNPGSQRQLRSRSAAIRAVREGLLGRGFLEVETPILQTIHGGANARPFRTHINAYDLPLYLRIAPELYLKRLMIGGMGRVFEIGRNFRNEGADATHNPEFTMLEAYEAYGDYTTMRHVARSLITDAALAATGGTVLGGHDHHGVRQEVDLAGEWPVITVNDAISSALGEQVTADTDRAALVRFADRLGIGVDPTWTRGAVLLELYEHLVEDRTVQPTFYTDFPAEVSPLTRQHRVDPRLAERWDLVAFGAEIGTAYSELVDPVVQRERLTEQSLLAAEGDPEAMELDEEFLTALEYAMPPSGGLGMGIDRLVMLLTETSIRETIAFPLVRPRTRG